MIEACRKIMGQTTMPVVKYAWYLEYKENNTHPHIHGMYETKTGVRIPKRQWMRAWPIWDEEMRLGRGFRGGYHRPIELNENYSRYIQKDGGSHDQSDNID